MVSIIIIVKNDPEIEATLSSLKSYPKPKGTEIIVVDSSGGELHGIKDKFPHVVWIDFKKNNKKNITIPEQRNVGVKTAKGDIIVFIDASCLPKKNWLIHLLNPIIKENEYIVAGITKSSKGPAFRDQAISKNKGIKYLREAPTINLAVKKVLFRKIGFFDESFEYGSDVDFTWRAVDAGYRIRVVPEAVITHSWGDMKDELVRSFRYGKARTQLYKKHIHRWRDLFRHDEIITIFYPLFLLGLPLMFFFPFYPLVLIIPIVRNLKFNPIKTTVNNIFYGFGVLYQFIGLFI